MSGCAETWRSTTCVCIDWGGFLITCSSRSQKALGLSSPEAEYYGTCSAKSELIYVMGVIRFFGFEVDGWILSDSSGALSLSQRKGVKHQRHIEARYVWIQDHLQRGTFKVGKIPGSMKRQSWGRNTWRVTIYNVTFELWDCENGKLPMKTPET